MFRLSTEAYGLIRSPYVARVRKAATMTTRYPNPPTHRAINTLVVVDFPKLAEAEQVRRELVQLQNEALVALEAAVVVKHDAESRVHLHQALKLITAGAVGGGFWGTLVGLLFLNPLLGAAVGAGVGTVSWALLVSPQTTTFCETFADTPACR